MFVRKSCFIEKLISIVFHLGFKAESNHGANNGLGIARNLLEEKIHKKYPEMSYGDLWTLAGVCAVQELVNIEI